MAYGGALNDDTNRYSGKSSGNPTRRTNDSGFMSYVDQDAVVMQLQIAKLENEIESETMQLKNLENENENNQKEYNQLMNEIIDSEREKYEIVYDDPLLEDIYKETKSLGIYADNNYANYDEVGYLLAGDRAEKLGIVRTTDRIDQFEIDQKYKQARDLTGDMAYNKKRIEDLKKSLEKNKQRLDDANSILPFDGTQSEGWNY